MRYVMICKEQARRVLRKTTLMLLGEEKYIQYIRSLKRSELMPVHLSVSLKLKEEYDVHVFYFTNYPGKNELN